MLNSGAATVVLHTHDKFGNHLDRGGLPVAARLQLVKQSVHDQTMLMPNNNSVEIVDKGDGTYHVEVMLIRLAATIKLIVNMDKNIPAAGGEMPPITLVFVKPEVDTPPNATPDSTARRPSSRCNIAAAPSSAASVHVSSPRRMRQRERCSAYAQGLEAATQCLNSKATFPRDVRAHFCDTVHLPITPSAHVHV